MSLAFTILFRSTESISTTAIVSTESISATAVVSTATAFSTENFPEVGSAFFFSKAWISENNSLSVMLPLFVDGGRSTKLSADSRDTSLSCSDSESVVNTRSSADCSPEAGATPSLVRSSRSGFESLRRRVGSRPPQTLNVLGGFGAERRRCGPVVLSTAGYGGTTGKDVGAASPIFVRGWAKWSIPSLISPSHSESLLLLLF